MVLITSEKQYTLFDNNSQLSNDYLAPFYFNGIEFKSMTHFLEFSKALYFHDYGKLCRILSCRSAADCKKLVKSLTHNEFDQWYKSIDNKAYSGLMCKFTQNPDILKALNRTDSSLLVFCDPNDGYWGCGLKKPEVSLTPPTQWPGHNKLGRELGRILEELQTLKKRGSGDTSTHDEVHI